MELFTKHMPLTNVELILILLKIFAYLHIEGCLFNTHYRANLIKMNVVF